MDLGHHDESHTGKSMSEDSYRFQKVIFVLGITLLVVKFTAWYLTSSVSILTDAMESIVNVIAGAVGLYALHLSSKPRDAEHPFGHGRVEIISSSIEGVMISTAGVLILLEALKSIVTPKTITDLDIGLVLVALAAIANYLVGAYAIRKGKKNRSQALVASGRHLCSDTYSSIGIIVGLVLMLILQWVGYPLPWLDGAIALLFGGIILYTGIKVIKESFDTIMDKADMEILEGVLETLNEHRHDHWIDIHNVRVVKYGSVLNMEMHAMFPRKMTVERQFEEINEVIGSVKEKFGDSVELNIMSEPCTDALCKVCQMDCDIRACTCSNKVEWTIRTIVHDDETYIEGK